ncbi:hypothetical protein ACQP1W_31480 [Spirillospora sp. CA-255316]
MSTHEAVLVPVRVTALMVNQDVKSTFFRRWRPGFGGYRHLSPEPDPLTEPASSPDPGVILHWELPLALRNGVLQPDGTTAYPEVPNRWLVVRYSGASANRSAAGWLVQSDCLRDESAADNSPYAVPQSGDDPTPVGKYVGRVIELDADLTDPADRATLTAVGPGLPTFALYQPYNLGIFSLHDRLTGLTGDRREVSYLVMGWYQDPARDPLAAAAAPADLAEALKRLGWEVPAPNTTARTVCAGVVTGVVWTAAAEPSDDEAPADETDPRKRTIGYGVAESTADGVSALALAYKPSVWNKKDWLRRLQALQYGLLHEFDTPDGAVAAQLRTRESRFEPVAGGFGWDFTTPPSTEGDSAVPVRPLPPEERAWITQTNADQRDYDDAVRTLARRQQRLYELWWYAAQLDVLIDSTSEPGLAEQLENLSDEIKPQLDPAVDGSLAKLVTDDRHRLDGASALLKAQTPELGKAIDDEVARLKKEWGRDPVGRPTRTPRPVFHLAREPIVMIKGARASRLLDDPSAVPCRLSGQTLVKADGDAVTPARPPGWDGLSRTFPAALPADLPGGLLTEFATLDRHPEPAGVTFADSATQVAWDSGDRRVLAVRRGAVPWRQPWTPLYLVWDGEYFAVPYKHYRDSRKKNWEFGEGQYEWRGEGDADAEQATPRKVSGKILLSAHAVQNIAERLDRIEEEAPGQDPDFVQAATDLAGYLADAASGSDLISQALDGFTEQLTGRDAQVRPRPPIAGQLDGNHAYAPRSLQAVTAPPDDETPYENWVIPPHYEPLRAGQFRFQRLFLVDRFGRSRMVVDTGDQADQRPSPARAASVIPDSKDPGQPNAADALVHVTRPDLWKPHLFQLRPRLPQPARLGFDAVSRLDDTQTAPTASSDRQIIAWIVPDYFDKALLCMAPDGTLLGELGPGDAGALVFERFHPDAPTLGQDSAEHPHLARFINGMNARDDRAGSLADLLATVEQIRLTTAPYRAGSTHPTIRMLGRPLALIRARLDLQPDAEPIVAIKPSLMTAVPPTAEYQDYTWPVLLGSAASFDDGLVGYFDQSDYGEIYAVCKPPEAQTGYVRDRGEDAGLSLSLGTSRLVTLLADPWGGVQANTHILPTGFLRVDPDLIALALSRMDAVFHVGPALGTLRPVPVKSGDGTEAVVKAFGIPLPVVETGAWSWRRPDGEELDVTGVDTVARVVPEFRAHLRTGLLHLRNGLTPP